MNTRVLYVLLFVQFVFAGALLFVGVRVREARLQDYLALTHRVTSGRGTKADFEKLIGHIPQRAEKEQIRVLFGPPLVRANRVDLEEDGKRAEVTGEVWLYYLAPDVADPENPPPAIDASDTQKLSGPQLCFVVTFDARGRASARLAKVVHPLPSQSPAAKP